MAALKLSREPTQKADVPYIFLNAYKYKNNINIFEVCML